MELTLRVLLKYIDDSESFVFLNALQVRLALCSTVRAIIQSKHAMWLNYENHYVFN